MHLEVLATLEASWLGNLPRTIPWLGPLASVLHVVALVVLLSAILAFDITVLGLDPGMHPRRAGRLLLPIARGAFALQAASGFVLFAAAATTIGAEPTFRLKLLLVGVALVNVAFFHVRAGTALDRLPTGPSPNWARLSAGLSLLVWSAVTIAGCFLHYP
ncbi:hypothetical protein [Arboricoccus pini]|uniref:hypothetical protein n=1 Tax=Arboricoccus pini TaxID=1963835 RepID=UPI0010562ACF|nr:hypothetical protein [Arboricoccus pini]